MIKFVRYANVSIVVSVEATAGVVTDIDADVANTLVLVSYLVPYVT